jgi:hypothetical protein
MILSGAAAGPKRIGGLRTPGTDPEALSDRVKVFSPPQAIIIARQRQSRPLLNQYLNGYKRMDYSSVKSWPDGSGKIQVAFVCRAMKRRPPKVAGDRRCVPIQTASLQIEFDA